MTHVEVLQRQVWQAAERHARGGQGRQQYARVLRQAPLPAALLLLTTLLRVLPALPPLLLLLRGGGGCLLPFLNQVGFQEGVREGGGGGAAHADQAAGGGQQEREVAC